MNFCLDTNILFSFQKNIKLGDSPQMAAQNLAKAAKTKKVRFFMPPRIVEELRYITEPDSMPHIDALIAECTIQSPTVHTQTVGVQVLYDYVDESRKRNLQGLHIAEEVIVHTALDYMQKSELPKIEFQKSLQPTKENLRTRYRKATRTGFVDSLADLDLIFLCKETDSHLISADEGVVVWGRKIGVKEMSLPIFGETINQVLSASS